MDRNDVKSDTVVLELRTVPSFLPSSIEMIEEKLIIILSRAENTTARLYVHGRDVSLIGASRFSH